MKKKRFVDKMAKRGHFRVTIFGSARIKKGNKMYNQVRILAKMAGERGYDIVTGGGPGLMRAANQGQHEGGKKTGSHSIGIGIKLPKEQKFNKHVDIKKEYKRFSKRLDAFMSLSNVIVIAPGGVGTLLELFYTWQLTQVHHVCDTPIILMGRQWPSFLRWLEKYPLGSKYLDKKDINLLYLSKDCNETIKIIDNIYKEYKEGGRDFCTNYKRYKLYR